MPISNAELNKRFGYHKPKNDHIADNCDVIRRLHCELAKELVAICPDSRELSLALTKLEESMQHSIAAVVRNQPDGPSVGG